MANCRSNLEFSNKIGGTICLAPTTDDRHLAPTQPCFTEADNCLIQDDWNSPSGILFMNPPFSNPLPFSNLLPFLEKLVSAIQHGQAKEAIILSPVNYINNIGTGEQIRKHAQTHCHLR